MLERLLDEDLPVPVLKQQRHAHTDDANRFRWLLTAATMMAGMVLMAALLTLSHMLPATQRPRLVGLVTENGGSAWKKKSTLDRCEAYLRREIDGPFSLILTADPGDFSGVSEAHYLLDNLRHRQNRPRGSSVCGGVSTGILLGQFVLVVTTGIGPSAASMCTLEVLSQCGDWIKDAIYFGTSGWSPQPGGLLNPPNCTHANWGQTITRIGDVCISPFSVNWTCKKSSYQKQTAGAPNQCSRPEEEGGPSDTQLFGECMFYKDNIHENLDLADTLVDIAMSPAGLRNFPIRSSNVSAHDTAYWAAAAEGAAREAPILNPSNPPTVWDYNTCMEVDGQFFYSGTPWELKARDYAAATLNAAIELLEYEDLEGSGASHAGSSISSSGLGSGIGSSSRNGKSLGVKQAAGAAASAVGKQGDSSSSKERRKQRLGPRQVSAADMIAVSAMEGVGVSEALLRYHSLTTTRQRIPFTNVRTISNWMVPPVTQTSPGMWEVLREVPDDFINGYAYSIATGSATILSFFQQRCLDLDLAKGKLSDPHRCEFTIDTNQLVTLLLASGRNK